MESILLYRSELLPISETFIASQAAALTKYRAQWVGLVRARPSQPIPEDSVLLTRHAGSLASFQRRLYVLTGIAPRFLSRLAQVHGRLIHAHFALDGALALRMAKRLSLPLVVTLHGYDVTRSDTVLSRHLAGRVYLRRRCELWDRAWIFLCASEFIKKRAAERGFPERKLRVHYIGVDRAVFRPLELPRHGGLILFVGRLVTQKGCAILLRAAAIARKHAPAITVVVIGDGPERRSLESMALSLEVPTRFLGLQQRATVREWLSRACVFCVPSVSMPEGDTEGLGMVFAEAQAMGLPVVSSISGGIPEVVRHEETGLLAPEGDSGLLADHLVRLLTDSAFWQSCSARGKEWIAKRFDLRNQTQELEDIYSHILVSGITQ